MHSERGHGAWLAESFSALVFIRPFSVARSMSPSWLVQAPFFAAANLMLHTGDPMIAGVIPPRAFARIHSESLLVVKEDTPRLILASGRTGIFAEFGWPPALRRLHWFHPDIEEEFFLRTPR